MLCNYRSQSYVFTSVCLSTGGGFASLHAGIPTPGPEAGTSRDQRQAPPVDQRQAPPRPEVGTTSREPCMLGDTGNKRTVRILMECNLV